MPKVHLSNLLVKRAICVDSKVKTDYFDTEVIGLMLEVRKSGNKTLYYRYNQEGKTIVHKLSDAQFMDIDDARRHALKMKRALAVGSLETLYVKKTKVPTMQQFYNDHYKPYVQKHIKSQKRCQALF